MSGKAEKRALVIGIGNILLRDEGLGVRVSEYFERAYSFSDNVRCLDGGTAGVNLLPALQGFTHLFFIDAISSADPPGTVRTFSAADIMKGPPLKTSAHFLGVKDLLAIAEFEGYRFEAMIIGVVPKDLSPGMDLSDMIRQTVPKAAETLAKELRKKGFDVREKRSNA